MILLTKNKFIKMKKVLFPLVAMSLFATTLISCQSNQKGTTETGSDTNSTTATPAAGSPTASTEAPSAAPKTGNEILDVSPTAKVETPEFSSEDVNAGFAKFEPLKEEYKAALDAKDTEKIKEVTAKYNAWVKEASNWGSKLPSSENQTYIDHYTKLVVQWDKLSKLKK